LSAIPFVNQWSNHFTIVNIGRGYFITRNEFGMLQGKIESISDVPEKEKYTVYISLPKGMTSSYNRQLAFRPQLQGETEIITEDLRVLERVFYQLRKLIVVQNQ
ncbi:MAG: hypothetical protein ACKODM_07655, partial [Cytophagales bacterium]